MIGRTSVLSATATTSIRASAMCAWISTRGSQALPYTAAMPASRRASTRSRLCSTTTKGTCCSSSVAAMRRPTTPWPTSTTGRVRVSRAVDGGSSASGSSRASRRRVRAERRRIQRRAGSTAENSSGFSAMDSSAPATTRLCASGGNTFRLVPIATRMKLNSPICARLADTVSAVFSG